MCSPGDDMDGLDEFMGPCYCGLPYSHSDHDMDEPGVIGPVIIRLKYELVGPLLPMEDS